MTVLALAATALTCVAMFQAPRLQDRNDDVVYMTDGLRTQVLYDLSEIGADRGSAWYFTNLGATGTVVFSANKLTTGRELYATRGLTRGTGLLTNINPGAASANPGGSDNPSSVPGAGTAYTTRLQKIGTRALFPATKGAHGRELWISDGTAAGTSLFKEHRPGAQDGVGASGGVAESVFSNGTFAIYLATDQQHGNSLWGTRGTAASTQFLARAVPGWPIFPAGFLANRILFGMDRQRELWITDGTPAGTTRLRTFASNGTIRNISRVKGTNYALLSVWHPTYGQELWVTDGTDRGTVLLKNINTGAADSSPGAYVDLSEYREGAYFKLGNRVIFPATDSRYGRELWTSDGTGPGTFNLADLSPGMASSEFHQFAVLGNRLYFSARVYEGTSRATRLFVTDGTRNGTRKLATSLSIAGRLVVLPGMLLFPARNPSAEEYLWRITPANPTPQAISGRLAETPRHFQNVNIPATNGVNRPCPAG